MGWRSVLAFVVLALVAGAGGFAYLSSSSGLPWSEEQAVVLPEDPDLAPAPSSAIAPAFATPLILQPGATQAEGQLLVLQARRAIEAGRPLGDLGTSLQLRFGATQPQALATISNGVKAPISNAALLAAFDALAPLLEQPVTTTWDRMRAELSTMFVIRAGDSAPSEAGQRTEEIRKAIIAGDIATAAAKVRKMPGAVKAGEWLVTANRAIAVHQALDLLAQSAAAPPPAPAPAPLIDPSAVPMTLPDMNDFDRSAP
jgi:hypothetical protein